MAGLHDFTTKEVLNKVLLDSSGNAVAAYSHTSQEALNAVLDSANSRLNVSLVGGTISGDVTISGDLTVEGSNTNATYDEIIQGALQITASSAFIDVTDTDSSLNVKIQSGDSIGAIGTSTNHPLSIRTNNTERIQITSAGDVQITDTTTSSTTEGGHLRLASNDGAAMASGHRLGVIEFAGAVDASSTITSSAKIQAMTDATWSASEHGTVLDFYTSDGSTALGSGNPMMRIDAAGNVAIGTDNASEKLSISSGNISLDSGYFVKFGTNNSRISTGGSNLVLQTGAVSRLILDDNSRISLGNNDAGGDTTNTVFGRLAGASISTGGINNTVFGSEAGNDISTGDKNTLIGYLAGDKLSTTSQNVVIGSAAGRGAGYADNVYIGYGVANSTSSNSSNNTLIGSGVALSGAMSGGDNTALGKSSLASITSGSSNVAVGANSLTAITSADNNVVLGYNALTTATTAYSNVVIGKDAMEQVPAGQAVNSCVAIGLASLKGSSSTTTGINGTISIGLSSLQSLTTGAGNLAIGLEAGKELSDNDRNIAIGYESLYNTNKAFAEDNIFIGYESGGGSWAVGSDLATGTFVNNGYDAHSSASANGFTATTSDGATNTSSNTDHIGLTTGKKYLLEFTATLTSGAVPTVNVLLGAGGSSAGLQNKAIIAGSNIITFTSTTTSNTTIQFTSIGNTNYTIADLSLKEASGASSVVAIGNNAMEGALDNQVGTVAIGHNALTALTTGGGNLAIGYTAGSTISSASFNTFVGYESGVGDGTASSRNTGLGYRTLKAFTSGASNTAIGNEALTAITTGSNNVAVGSGAGVSITEGSNNIAIGSASLDAVTTGSSSIAIGHNALTAVTSGVYNVAIGYNAAAELEDNHANTVIGYQAMYRSGTTTYHNVYIGNLAGDGDWTGACHSNTAVGSSVMRGAMTSTAVDNVAMGRDALAALTSGHSNVAIGKNAGASIVDATYNTAVGHNAGDATVDGGRNVSLGAFSHGNADTGDKNIAIGYQSGYVMTGSNNITVGNQSGDSITSGGNNTIIGDTISTDTATTSNQTVIGSGGVFKFQSKEYTCDHASDDDNDVASSEASPIKIPAYSVIKSVSAIISQLANISTYNLAVFYSNDTSSPADDSGLTSGVELIGASASTSKSGHTGNAEDMVCGGGSGLIKKSFYNGFDGNGLHVGNGDRYIHLVNAGTGNGDTDPSTSALVKVLVEYVGLD